MILNDPAVQIKIKSVAVMMVAYQPARVAASAKPLWIRQQLARAQGECGAPGRSRTGDNQLRRLGLCPTELRARLKSKWQMADGISIEELMADGL